MAAHPIVVVDDELLEKIPESFRTDPRYQKGTSLELVPVVVPHAPQANNAKGDWRRLEGFLRKPDWTPEERVRVVERKRKAKEELDRVYASEDAGATELKAAEREWELADDELDFGPFRSA